MSEQEMTDEKFVATVQEIISAYMQDIELDYVRDYLADVLGYQGVELEDLTNGVFGAIVSAAVETHEVLEGTCA